MATKRKDWKAEWEAIAKENRKLAKRANQRLVRLERAAKKPGMASVKEFAYKVAMRDLTSLGKTGEKKRFTEAPKLMQINDGSKNLTGDALYRANVMRAKSEQKMLKSFLSAASSTIGKARAYEDEGIKATEGVRAVWDKVTNTINDKYLSEYDLQMTDNDLKRFWDSKKQAKLETVVGSNQMFAVAAIMKKYSLKANKRDFERFLRNNMTLPSGAEYKQQKGESFNEYLERVQDFAQYTDDEVLNDAINRALKNGINVNNIFI